MKTPSKESQSGASAAPTSQVYVLDQGTAHTLSSVLTLETVLTVHGQTMRHDEYRLRRLLAMATGGRQMYTDDGELQCACEQPHIDFLRDSVGQLEAKLHHRALNRFNQIPKEQIDAIFSTIRPTENKG